MYVIKYIFIVAVALMISASASGQQNEEEEEDYHMELIAGVNFNTNANILGGLMVKYSRQIKKGRYHSLGLEIVNVRHRMERGVVSPATGNSFVFGKLNYLFPVRLQYGREFLLFHPMEEEGVQVNFIVAGGPTLGIVKPYMLEYEYGNFSKVEPYDPNKGRNILGSGGIVSGFEFLKVVPGINIKASVCLGFSQFKGSVTGIEVGGLLEFYTQNIQLMASPSFINPQPYSPNSFSSVFVNIFFGMRK
jgi:hypothetical protein